MSAEPSSPRTVVVAGAGPGLGMALARRFGTDGHRVGLVARRQEALDAYVDELRGLGVEAEAARADLGDPAELAAAFGALRNSLGDPHALVFSPMPDLATARCEPSAVTADVARRFYADQTLAAVGCVQQVLPAMLERGAGSLYLTTGTSALVPLPMITPLGMSHAAIRNYARCLYEELGPRGIDVHHVNIQGGIGAGDPELEPAAIATVYRELLGTDAPETVVPRPRG
jgi:NAD(P)-dependent dehydrogenase (short-subunit alcohol dehydrogenase family)